MTWQGFACSIRLTNVYKSKIWKCIVVFEGKVLACVKLNLYVILVLKRVKSDILCFTAEGKQSHPVFLTDFVFFLKRL